MVFQRLDAKVDSRARLLVPEGLKIDWCFLLVESVHSDSSGCVITLQIVLQVSPLLAMVPLREEYPHSELDALEASKYDDSQAD